MPSRKGTRYKEARGRQVKTDPATKEWPKTRRFASTLTNIIAILALFILVYVLQHFTGWFTDHKAPTEVKTDHAVTEGIQQAIMETAKEDEVEVLPPPPPPQAKSETVKETISEAKVAATDQPAPAPEEIKEEKTQRYQPRHRRISRRTRETRLAARHRATVDDLDNEEARLRYLNHNKGLAHGAKIPEDHSTWSKTTHRPTRRPGLETSLAAEYGATVEDLDNEAARHRYQEQNRILASGGTIPEGYSPRSAAYSSVDDFIPFERQKP